MPDRADLPIPFYPRTAWWVVSSDSSERVAEVLNVRERETCDWDTGVRRVGLGDCFVTPSVEGWTIISGPDLPPENPADVPRVIRSLVTLSKVFGESQVFCSPRHADFHLWGRARNGEVARGFGTHVYETVWSCGYDAAEEQLGFHEAEEVDEDDEDEFVTLGASLVWDMSRMWSICADDLKGRKSCGKGFVGTGFNFF